MNVLWLTCLATMRSVAVLGLLAVCGLCGGAGQATAKSDDPEPLPEAAVTAWTNAGAKVGSMRFVGLLQFVPAGQGEPGDLPAFRFSPWRKGRLAGLPDPGRPFALDLSGTDLTDAGLKELAGLKSLQMLGIGLTRVTDGGLKELAGLKNLQTLGLGATAVTDTGLKELVGLKNLQSLNLFLDHVTDAGVKELAALKSLQVLNLGGTKVTDAGLKELAGNWKSKKSFRNPVSEIRFRKQETDNDGNAPVHDACSVGVPLCVCHGVSACVSGVQCNPFSDLPRHGQKGRGLSSAGRHSSHKGNVRPTSVIV
jgi:hypothetical protein